jgi:hypothetical protein
LLPRAEKARDVLPKEITKRGGHIDVVTVYRTGKGEGNIQQVKELFRKKLIQVITFTSSSTVKNFVKLLAEKNISKIIKGAVVASIGPMRSCFRHRPISCKSYHSGLIKYLRYFLFSNIEKGVWKFPFIVRG